MTIGSEPRRTREHQWVAGVLDRRRLVQVSCGWPQVGRFRGLRAKCQVTGCAQLGASGADSVSGLCPEEKRQSRVDGQVCPSTLPVWFVHRQVRLTKPPQIAVLAGRARTAPAGSDSPQVRLTCGDWCRFRAAGRGSGAHPTRGFYRPRARKRTRRRTPRASAGRPPPPHATAPPMPAPTRIRGPRQVPRPALTPLASKNSEFVAIFFDSLSFRSRFWAREGPIPPSLIMSV